MTILQNGQTLFSEDRFAKIGADFTDFTFSEEQRGLTVVRFSNISGSGQQTEFAFVVGGQMKETSIPEWVKNNAGWWADGQIPDSAFIDGIEFLIKEGLIVVSSEQQSESQTDGIPEWVKNNAGWWADGQIPDSAFIDGIEFLIKDGIININ
jgi:hypothetical protein